MYRVQSTIDGRHWRDIGFSARATTESAAWAIARSYDPDGFLMPDVRVVGPDGKPVPRPAN